MHLAPEFKFHDPTPLKAKANIAEMESFTHWHACDIPFAASANRATDKESANYGIKD
jgi:phosphatidylethanolamine-binding protein (PEBP) family uncharacterized protein